MKLCNNSKSVAVMLGCIRNFTKMIHDTFESSEILKIYHILHGLYQYFSWSDDDGEKLADIVKWKHKLKEVSGNYSLRALELLLFILPRFCFCHTTMDKTTHHDQWLSMGSFDGVREHEYNILDDHWNMYRVSKAYTRVLNGVKKHFAYYDYVRNVDAVYIIGLEYGSRYSPILDERCQCLLEWFIIQKYMQIDKKKTKIPFFYYGIADNRWRQCLLKSAKSGAYEWDDVEMTKNKQGINDININSNRYCISASKPSMLNDIKAIRMERLINEIFITIDHDYNGS